MCTGRCQFRKPGAVERNQRAENIGGQAPVIFRTSVSPYAQQRPTWHHGHQTAEMEGGFCFESTDAFGNWGVIDVLFEEAEVVWEVVCREHAVAFVFVGGIDCLVTA